MGWVAACSEAFMAATVKTHWSGVTRLISCTAETRRTPRRTLQIRWLGVEATINSSAATATTHYLVVWATINWKAGLALIVYRAGLETTCSMVELDQT